MHPRGRRLRGRTQGPAAVALSLWALAGCFETHRVDGAADGGLCPGAPPRCFFFDGAEGCCTDSGPPASCGETGWDCPPSALREAACPRFCVSAGCTGEPPRCAAVRNSPADPCCDADARTPATCDGSAWQCPPDHVEESQCVELGLCSAGGACDGLPLARCLSEGCAPVFDDFCCPSCGDERFCADCVDWAFLRCEPFAERCLDGGPSPCGAIAEAFCDGGAPDCSEAFPTSEAGCSVAGCVPAVQADCPECEALCVPARATSCEALCPADPLPCPDRMVPEGDGTCFTGRCIPASVCGL